MIVKSWNFYNYLHMLLTVMSSQRFTMC